MCATVLFSEIKCGGGGRGEIEKEKAILVRESGVESDCADRLGARGWLSCWRRGPTEAEADDLDKARARAGGELEFASFARRVGSAFLSSSYSLKVLRFCLEECVQVANWVRLQLFQQTREESTRPCDAKLASAIALRRADSNELTSHLTRRNPGDPCP